MKTSRLIPLLAISLMTAFFPYCKGSSQTAGSGSATPAMASTSQYIDAQMGGTITLGNQMTLSIPAGSLDASTEISVSQVAPPIAQDGVNPLVAYSFNQHGLQFHIPATLKICYPGSAVTSQNLNEDSTAIYHDDDSNYASYAGLIDKTNHCVQTEINHFSTYFVAAQSLLSVNAAPSIGGVTFMPATPVAGIPLKIRSVVTDFNATGRGQVASVWLHYCVGNATVCTTPASFTKVAMTIDTTSTVTTNRYTYTLPASAVTTAGIRYFIESVDNLRATRISPTAFRAITATATGLTIIPPTLDIAAGFSRQYNVRVTATAGAAQDIDFAPLTVGNGVGTTALNNQGVWLFNATTSGDPLTTGFRTGSVIATLGAFSAAAPVKVWPGQLTAIQILDSLGVVLGSNISLAPNATFDFDARGLDAFGNFSLVYPAWIVTNPLVGSIPGNNGLFNASGNDGQSGQVLAVVDNISGSVTVNIVAPPTVTLSLANSPFSENGGVATVTANLSQAYGSATTVNLAFSGSAPGTDYLVSSASIIIPAGQTSGSITLTGVDNAVFDGSRTVIVDIASVINGTEVGTEQVTATIQDDETAPYPIAATPVDGSTNNPVTTSISVTFNIPMNPATMTTSTSTSCTGSLQLSADNFVTCVAMNASLGVMSNGNATVTFTPAAALANNTLYKIRATTAVQAASGAPLASTLTSPNGWTTEGLPAPNSFVSRAPMSTARNYLAMVQVSGKLYAIGGLDGATGGFLDLIEEYDPVTNVWTTKNAMPTPRAYLGAAVIGNKIYVIGGRNDPTGITSLATVEMYDPAINAWVTKSSMPTARDKLMVAAASNGKIYAIGGIYGAPFGGEYLQTVEEYDPISDSWASKSDMPTSRGYAAAITLSTGNILVCGGNNWNLGWIAKVEEYNPSTDSWVVRSPMNMPRYGLSGALGANGKAYTFGGYAGSPAAITEEFDPLTNSWAIKAPMSQGRLGSAAAQGPNGNIYIVGGTFFPTTEEYLIP